MSKLLDETAKGVYIIAATPFQDNGELDLPSAERMVDFYLECGVTGITILGVMGEAPKLSPQESAAFAETCIKRVAGRVPVVVGVSAAGNRNLGNFAKKSMDLGAGGVMVAPIAGLKTEEQIEAYYGAIAKELGDIPVVVQDYPQLTNVHMSVSLINRLFAQFPSFKVLKHEDMPGLRKLSKVRAADNDGSRKRRISILVGNSALYLPQEMRRARTAPIPASLIPKCWSNASICSWRESPKRRRIFTISTCRSCATSSRWAWDCRCARKCCAGAASSNPITSARPATRWTRPTTRSSTS